MQLESELYGRITVLCDAGNNHLGAGEVQRALALFEQALALLPAPPEQWEAATWIFAALADCHFEAGNFEAVRDAARQAVACPGGLGNPFVHLRLGQAQLELGNTERAKDELARAYMGGGDELFEGDDPKYWRFIREVLRPPASEIGE